MTTIGSVVVLLLLAVLVIRNTDERMSPAQPAVTRSVSQRAERTVVPDESTAETSLPTVQLREHVIGVSVETLSPDVVVMLVYPTITRADNLEAN